MERKGELEASYFGGYLGRPEKENSWSRRFKKKHKSERTKKKLSRYTQNAVKCRFITF